jgi:hypothetical protein
LGLPPLAPGDKAPLLHGPRHPDAGALSRGPRWRPARPRPAGLAGLPRLARAAAGAARRPSGRRLRWRAIARELDADFHGQRRQIRRAVLSAVPVGRAVRQAEGGQRRRGDDRHLHDEEALGHGARCWPWCWPADEPPGVGGGCFRAVAADGRSPRPREIPTDSPRAGPECRAFHRSALQD